MLNAEDRLFRFNDGGKKPLPRWVEVQESYSNAGLALLRRFQNSKARAGADVYPALFLCRHAVELELKSAVAISYVADHATDIQQRLDEIFKTHDLLKLWERFVECREIRSMAEFAEEHFHPFKMTLDTTRQCIVDIVQIDPGSMAFRYAVDKQLKSIDIAGLSIPNFIAVYTRLIKTLSSLRRVVEEIIKEELDYSYSFSRNLYWLDRLNDDETRLNRLDISGDAERQALSEESED